MHKIVTTVLFLFGSAPVFAMACAADDNAGSATDGGGDGSVTTLPSSPAPTMTCDPGFCPAMGAGSPCCMSSMGPCGMDVGMGCVQVLPENRDGG